MPQKGASLPGWFGPPEARIVVQLLSHVWHFTPHGLQHARLSCPSLSPGVCSNTCPLSRWCHPTISSSIVPFSSCPQSFPAPGSFPVSQLSSHQVAKRLELQLQHQTFQWIFRIDILYDWLVECPCYPSYSQESSPTPQFKSINSLALSFLYGPTLTSTLGYGKNQIRTWIWNFSVKCKYCSRVDIVFISSSVS